MGDEDLTTTEATKESDPGKSAKVPHAHAVRPQRAKLAYLKPSVSSMPRVAPVGYESPEPEKLPSLPMREARIIRGISIRELSRRSGISPSTIYRVERSKTFPRPHVAHAISAAMECSPWEIEEFREVMAATPLPR
jgi:predicted DNA-binding transcriptional regulator AlpA